MLGEAKTSGGTAGPGEEETIQIIEEAGASVDNPIDVHIGRRVFEGVTGAIKPARTSYGEAKIDVLLLSGPNQGHPAGAFSFKDAKFPTYAGYASTAELIKGGSEDVENLFQSYIEMLNPREIQSTRPGFRVYRFAGDFAMPCSDRIARFAIYGRAENSGGAEYGKPRVDHVVEVIGPLTWSWVDDSQTAIKISGLKVYPQGYLFRGDPSMEPYWLVRKASKENVRSSGTIITGTRIAIAPAQRACGSERCVVKEDASDFVSPAMRAREHTYRDYSMNGSWTMRDRHKRVLTEELTAADKREIEKIARRQSEIVLRRELGPDIMKTIRDEVEKVTGKTLASKDSRAQIEELVIAVVKRLYKDITVGR